LFFACCQALFCGKIKPRMNLIFMPETTENIPDQKRAFLAFGFVVCASFRFAKLAFGALSKK
jgi:hypothetical protein